MVFLGNAFSLNMMVDYPVTIIAEQITVDEVKNLLTNGFVSVIGHASTADVLSKLLEQDVQMNRTQLKLTKNDILIVFQLGVRIEEGKVLTRDEILQLPYKFVKVTLK